MSHFAHLVRWDVRRFRAILLGWLLVVAATTTLDAIWPQMAVDPVIRRLLGTIAGLLTLTELLLSFVLIAQVVHAHALVGTTAFWMTRPIPPASLLNAKLALVGVTMIATPVLADVIVMTIYRVLLADIIGVSIQAAHLRTLWIVALVVAAAATPNLAKFAFLIGTALIGIVVLISLMVAVAMYRFEAGPPQALSLDQVASYGVRDPTSDVIGMTLTIVALLAFLLVQYGTRRRWLSFATGLAGVLLAWAISSAWPWPFLAPVLATPGWAANPATLSLAATADTVVVEPTISFPARPVDWRQARARVQLRGIEPGWTANVGVRGSAVEMPGGAQLISNYAVHPSGVPVEGHGDAHQQRAVIRTLLGVSTLIDPQSQDRAEDTIVLFARGADISRTAPNEGTFRGRFYVTLTNHAIEAVLPLTRGALHQNGSYRISIADVQFTAGNLFVVSQQSDAVSMFARRSRTARSFYLRNTRVSEAIHLASHDLRMEVSMLTFVPFFGGFTAEEPSGFSARAEMLFYSPRSGQAEASVALDNQWVNGAELVIVGSTQGGSVERELAIANFPIRAE